MKLTYDKGFFSFICKFEEREIPKKAGFFWNSGAKLWQTKYPAYAKKLLVYADDSALELLSEKKAAETKAIIQSRKKIYEYQEQGVNALLSGARILADEMGLGKTVQAITYINQRPFKHALIVCPVSLKLNWKKEFLFWFPNIDETDITIVNTGKEPMKKINIVNYERVPKLPENFFFDVVVLDESHYIKNDKTARFAYIAGRRAKGKNPAINGLRYGEIIFMTGTPLLNRPVELYSTLKILKHPLADNWMSYVRRYCAAKKTRFGWDTRGASNLEELRRKLQGILIRREKKDVLKQLPEKTCQVITLSSEGYDLSHENPYQEIFRGAWDFNLDFSKHKIHFSEMAEARHETALQKLPAVIEHVRSILEQEEKVIVFAHHHDVIEGLEKGLEEFKTVTITGDTKDRQAIVEKFNLSDSRVFIGSIRACGVGFTLTAAHNVIFAELDWTPALMAQAEDRAHRIGQKNAVLSQYIVVQGSIDENIANMLLEKKEIIDKVIAA